MVDGNGRVFLEALFEALPGAVAVGGTTKLASAEFAVREHGKLGLFEEGCGGHSVFGWCLTDFVDNGYGEMRIWVK